MADDSPAGEQPHFRSPNQINIIVTGGTTSNYFRMGGLLYVRSVEISSWR